MGLFRRDRPAEDPSSRHGSRAHAPAATIHEVRAQIAQRRFHSADRSREQDPAQSVPPGDVRRPGGFDPLPGRMTDSGRDDQRSPAPAPDPLTAHEQAIKARVAEPGLDAPAEYEAPQLIDHGDAPHPPETTKGDTPMPSDNVSATDRHDREAIGGDASTTTFATVKRTIKEFQADGLTDWAASLTYYGLLSLFPGLIAFVSILGIFGDPATTTKTLTDIVGRLAPGSAASTFEGPIQSIVANKGTAGVMFFVGIFAALWSASSYIGAFMRASNVIYETPEGRPFWKLRPLQLLVTFVMVILLVAVVLALVFTGPVVDAVAGPIGVGHTAVTVWNIAKWPVLVAVVLVMLGVLYYASPNVKLPKFSLITPGAMLALTVWVLASVAFAFYVANFGSYDKTYGTLGGVISLLVWMWISNVALLLGAELNAEIERTRELRDGIPEAAREIQLDARSAPKEPATT